MSDEPTPTPEPTPVPAPPAPSAPAEPELPDWARKQISDANTEAAKYRVQLKEAREARKALEDQVVTLTNEKSATATSATSIQSDFDRLVPAIQAEGPHDKIFAFAKTVQSDTEDELKAHAEELKSMFSLNPGPVRAVDRSQGHGAEPTPPSGAEA